MLTVALTLATCGLAGAPAALLARIVEVESAGSALAINVNGDVELVHQPRDLREAVAMARWLLERGYNFDAGIAQINSSSFDRLGLDVEALFDACTSLWAGWQVLAECRSRAGARFGKGRPAEDAAISCYNTGDLSRGIRNGYVAAVRGVPGGRAARTIATAAPGESMHTDMRNCAARESIRRVADVFGAGPAR